MTHHRSAPRGFAGAVLLAGILAAAPLKAEPEKPFSFRPDLPERSSARPSPAAQQRAYGYDSALRGEVRRLEQRREPLASSSAYRLNKARSEQQRVRSRRR